jgi:16S rRNA (cytosine967-C5)-methyltransferase
VIAPARRVAYEVLVRIEQRRAFSDYALNSATVNALELRDRRFVTEVVYGALRHQSLLDQVLSETVSRPLEETEPAVRILLRMALYQLWQLDRVPQHAVVDDAVKLSKAASRRSAGFVNAVLRGLTRSRPWEAPDFPQQYPPWIRVSLPEWLWKRWETRWGAERALQFGDSLNDPPARSSWVPEGGGDPRYQDEASQLIAHLLGDVTGWSI